MIDDEDIRFKVSAIIGFIVGVAVMVYLSQFIPEVTCKDGWDSPSIGRQGACSHHGGVRGNGGSVFLVCLASFVLGFFVFSGLDWLLGGKEKKAAPKLEAKYRPKQSSELKPSKEAKESYEYIKFNKELSAVKLAITEKKDIEFMYTKPRAERAELRQVTPEAIREVPHKNSSSSTLCVVGNCKKREAIRVFALKRISRLRVL